MLCWGPSIQSAILGKGQIYNRTELGYLEGQNGFNIKIWYYRSFCTFLSIYGQITHITNYIFIHITYLQHSRVQYKRKILGGILILVQFLIYAFLKAFYGL